MMVIADTASSRMTNERYKWLEEVYIFYRDVSLSSARKKIRHDPIFTNIFIIRRMPTFREAEIF